MISPELLRRYPLFAGQSPYMLDEISMISNEIMVKEGDWLFQEGAEASKFYLLLEGEISLTMYLHVGGNPKYVSMMDPIGSGEIIGWSGLVKPHQYTLGAKAVKKSRLIEMEAGTLRQLLDDNPEFGYNLMKQIAEVIGERVMYKSIQQQSMVIDSKDKSVE